MSKSKLGAGAASLLGSFMAEEKHQPQEVALSSIEPNPQQPRQFFDAQKLQELAQSIRQNGILQPLLVEQAGERFLLIAGERRLRAAEIAGLTQVPVIVRQFSSEQKLEVALIENIQRENLTPIELAQTYEQLIKLLGLSHEELANRLGKSRSAITNTLRLLQLPADIQKSLDAKEMSAGHARALLSLEDKPLLQQKLYETMIKEALSVRQTEERAKVMMQEQSQKATKVKAQRIARIVKTEKKLMENLGVKLQIKGDEQRGVIAIRYHSKEKLNHIIALLEQTDNLQ